MIVASIEYYQADNLTEKCIAEVELLQAIDALAKLEAERGA